MTFFCTTVDLQDTNVNGHQFQVVRLGCTFRCRSSCFIFHVYTRILCLRMIKSVQSPEKVSFAFPYEIDHYIRSRREG